MTVPQWMLKLTEANCQPLDGTVEPRCHNSTGHLFCQHIWKNNTSLHPKSNFTHLHFLQGLHMDAAALAVFYEGQLKGVHQDDSSEARGVSALHVVQQHLSFVRLVTDDRGDFSWKYTTTREHTHTHPCVSIVRINKHNKTLINLIQFANDSSCFGHFCGYNNWSCISTGHFCSEEVVLPVLMMNLMASGPSVSYRGTTTME